jgi:hypothetical protein
MAIDTEGRQNVDYFIGVEVEHTPMKGERTLFVVGVKPVEEIVLKVNNLRHIYLGTSQSFNPQTYEDWKSWNHMITGLLELGYWVTLDFDAVHARDFHEEGWCENDRFIPMISVKLPYIGLFNYNTTVKIDDTTWGDTNPGVWTHSLHSLMDRKNFTSWDKYTEDTPL